MGRIITAAITRADGKSRMDILHYRAEQGFSRPAHLTLHHGLKLSQLRPIWRPLRASLIASHGRAVWRRLWANRTKARLNPIFVSWLMGFPKGHALCGSLEMLSFQSKPLTPGAAWPPLTASAHVILENTNDPEELPSMRVGLCSRAVPQQVLQQALPASGVKDRAGICPDGRRAGTPSDDGAAPWPQVTDDRACTPQEREETGQPHRQLRSADGARSHQPASVQISEDEDMSVLRGNLYATQSDEGAGQNLLQGLPLQNGIRHNAHAAFLKWQWDMRGALSRLPTASGAWIWKPPVPKKAAPMQGDLFAEAAADQWGAWALGVA